MARMRVVFTKLTLSRDDNTDLLIKDKLLARRRILLTGNLKVNDANNLCRQQIETWPGQSRSPQDPTAWDQSVLLDRASMAVELANVADTDRVAVRLKLEIENENDGTLQSIGNPMAVTLSAPFSSQEELAARRAYATFNGRAGAAFFVDWTLEVTPNPSSRPPASLAVPAAVPAAIDAAGAMNNATTIAANGQGELRVWLATSFLRDDLTTSDRNNSTERAKIGEWRARIVKPDLTPYNPEITAQASDWNPNRRGLTLTTSGLPDGNHLLILEPMENARKSQAPVGPDLAEGLPDPLPERIYRPIHIEITTVGGALGAGSVRVRPCLLADGSVETTHTRIAANGIRWGANIAWANNDVYQQNSRQLLIDVQPVWMRCDHDRPPGELNHIPAINVYRPTSNLDLIVVHYTSGSRITGALSSFLGHPPGGAKPASANYIINIDGHIVKMVRDTWKSCNVGGSIWGRRRHYSPGQSNNDHSIGIEIVHEGGTPYRGEQFDALAGLLDRTLQRYPSIGRHRVIGHSDLGSNNPAYIIGRKADPGPEFEWERYEQRSIGMLRASRPAQTTIAGYYGGFFQNPNPSPVLQLNSTHRIQIEEVQWDLDAIGYGVFDLTGIPAGRALHTMSQGDFLAEPNAINAQGQIGQFKDSLRRAVEEFQEHFGVAANGRVDARTAILIKQVRSALEQPGLRAEFAQQAREEARRAAATHPQATP